MTTPHKCPVCFGTGKMTEFQQADFPEFGTSIPIFGTGVQVTCHACSGKGIVWSPEVVQDVQTSGGGKRPAPTKNPILSEECRDKTRISILESENKELREILNACFVSNNTDKSNPYISVNGPVIRDDLKFRTKIRKYLEQE